VGGEELGLEHLYTQQIFDSTVSINLRPFKGHDISGRHLCQSNNLAVPMPALQAIVVAKTRHYSLRALSCSDRVFLGHSRAGPLGLAHLAIYSHHGSMASLVMRATTRHGLLPYSVGRPHQANTHQGPTPCLHSKLSTVVWPSMPQALLAHFC
jgi:hypothetical protein